MVPRATMLVTKNRAEARFVALLALVVMLSACAPPGPRALLKGKKLLDAGQTTAAIAELNIATVLMPTNAAAWNYLGVAYHRTGQWTNAAAAYSQALRFNRDLLEARFNLGCLALEQNNPEAAKADLFTYTSRRPNDGDAWVKLGSAQMQTRDLAAAENSFREALRVDAKDVSALNGLGMVFAQKNRVREAGDVFAIALKYQPDFRPALLNLATVLQQQNNRAGALQRYREYLALEPRDADWEGVNAIVRALDPASLNPSPAAATNRIAAAPQSNNTRQVAVPPAKSESTPPPPPKPTVSATPASRTTAREKPPEPEVVQLPPEPVVKVAPDTAPAPAVKSATMTEETPRAVVASAPSERKGFFSKLNPFRRDPKPAVEPASVSLPAALPPAEAVVAAGSRYRYVNPTLPASGDRKAAERELVEGQQAQAARRLSEAIQHYRRATAIDGSYFEGHFALGLALFEARNFKSAAAEWETAITIRPDSSDAHYNFAFTLKAAGYHRDAANELEKLLALHPDEARGHLTLGNLYAEQLGDKTRARLHYNKVLELEPRNPQAQAIRYWLVANPG